MGAGVALIDSAEETARSLAEALAAAGLGALKRRCRGVIASWSATTRRGFSRWERASSGNGWGSRKLVRLG